MVKNLHIKTLREDEYKIVTTSNNVKAGGDYATGIIFDFDCRIVKSYKTFEQAMLGHLEITKLPTERLDMLEEI